LGCPLGGAWHEAPEPCCWWSYLFFNLDARSNWSALRTQENF
jgi:hypothetical protein